MTFAQGQTREKTTPFSHAMWGILLSRASKNISRHNPLEASKRHKEDRNSWLILKGPLDIFSGFACWRSSSPRWWLGLVLPLRIHYCSHSKIESILLLTKPSIVFQSAFLSFCKGMIAFYPCVHSTINIFPFSFLQVLQPCKRDCK